MLIFLIGLRGLYPTMTKYQYFVTDIETIQPKIACIKM